MRTMLIVLLAALFAAPTVAMAEVTSAELQKQIEELTEELEDISSRLDTAEKHTATDRISFSGDMRVKADSLHYQDITVGQFPFLLDDNPAFGLEPVNFNPDGTIKRETGDLDNDILYTTRLRLNMKAKVYNNVNFSGRLSMYKNWGDSSGVKVFDSFNGFTQDGTNSGNTTGDWLRVERAYFDWKDIGGSNFYLSIGRRPSTYGPHTQYRENELRGGTPTGHLVNFNFDGITVGYKLGEHTGIEGQTVRFCYGQGYESEWGNGELFNQVELDDTHLGGFNIDAWNDGTNFLQLTAFAALDVTDGFKGLVAIPDQFLGFPGLDPAFSTVPQAFPGFNFVTRMQARENIGDIYLGAIGFAREEMNGVNWFTSLGWTRTDPSGAAGPFGGLLNYQEFFNFGDPDQDGIPNFAPTGRTVSVDEEDGWSVYAGIQVPAPMGKLGLEYNYGSQYWIPFTQSQDDVIGSKLATRGHVGEAYYIFEVNPRMFIKLGGLYYDYEYTGSGAPVGEPKDIDDVIAGKEFSLLPAVDTAYDINTSLTIKF
ncbi:MAG: DUF3373 domain-containing protein [Desulfuromonas sp.]|uniref:DUF3373 domain-containing protein n=1 Tax=Desulfuromonas sp. TaxID=892 RepID=UPI000CB6D05F|nr:DUF3373 domain-containing protein [Desulfuromonas sp.]PLX85513.1 MAG: DUF3373 domain-containing protein [Desulfuromonas sp.]